LRNKVTKKRISFQDYLLEFKNEKSNRGIFARWFDGTLLTRIKNLIEIESMMKQSGCSDFLVNEMKQCWEDFEKLPNAQTSITIYNDAYTR